MIDYWKLTKDFAPGDVVQKYVPGQGALSPFAGKVTAVHKGIGFVDVQWPFGNERVSPEEVVRINPDLIRYLPPSLDQTYSAWDVEKGRRASMSKSLWRTASFSPNLYHDMAKLWTQGEGEVSTYDTLYRKYGSQVSDPDLRSEVQNFYLLGRNMMKARLAAHISKSAAYWYKQNRAYRATKEEITRRSVSCPKCGTPMRRTTYKMEKGQKARLFACPKDLFLIKIDSILGPGGEPVAW